MNSPEAGVGYKIWAADDVVYGPVELPTLVDWIRDERVEAGTWVYSEQTDTWNKASNVPDLGMFFRGRAAGTARAVSADGPTPLVQGIRPGMLRRVKILAEMNDQQLGRFVQFMEVKQVRQFNEVVRQGEHGDAMFLILEGEVRVRMMIAQKESTMSTLPAGEFFGEMTLFDQGPRSADVVANNDCTLLKISHTAFTKLVSEAPDLATPFLLGICRTLTARMRAGNKRHRDTMNFVRASSHD